MLAGFDPNILLSGRPFDPFGAAAKGWQQGQGIAMNKQNMDANKLAMDAKQAGLDQDQALMGLSDAYQGEDPFIKQALAASPDVAKEIIAQRLKAQYAKQQPEKFGLNIHYGLDEDNNLVAMQTSNRSGLTVANLPEGVQALAPGFDYKDTGDTIEKREQKTGKLVEVIEKSLTPEGKQSAEQFTASNLLADKRLRLDYAKLKHDKFKTDLQRIKDQYNIDKEQAGFTVKYEEKRLQVADAVDTIDRMIGNEARGVEPHSGFTDAVGAAGAALLWGAIDEPFRSTDARGFIVLHNKIKGKAFLEGIQQLRGTGPVTDVEGEKATQALMEMDTATNEKEYKKAALRFRKHATNMLSAAAKERKLKSRPDLSPKSGNTVSVYSVADLKAAFKKRFGHDPSGAELDRMKRNAGL